MCVALKIHGLCLKVGTLGKLQQVAVIIPAPNVIVIGVESLIL